MLGAIDYAEYQTNDQEQKETDIPGIHLVSEPSFLSSRTEWHIQIKNWSTRS